MTTTPTIIKHVNETVLMADIIGEAFASLDVSRYLIPDDSTRRWLLALHLHQLVALARQYGEVSTNAERTAVAVWLDVFAQGLPDIPEYEQTRRRILGEHDQRFAAFEHTMHERHPTGTMHRYLAFLAVRPDLQGRGLGSVLLQHQHAQLDQRGVPAYLEAADQNSRRLYLRHGYTDHGQPFPCAPVGPLVYPMWREPHTTAAT